MPKRKASGYGGRSVRRRLGRRRVRRVVRRPSRMYRRRMLYRRRRLPASFNVRPEVKEFSIVKVNDDTDPVGQFQYDGVTVIAAERVINISCNPFQGLGFTNRIGRKIVLKKMYINIQFAPQVNAHNDNYIVLEIFRLPGADAVINSGTMNEIYRPNPFCDPLLIYDANCERNPDYMYDYKRVLRRKFKFLSDTQATLPPQRHLIVKRMNMPIWFFDDTNVIRRNKLIMVLRTANGNAGPNLYSGSTLFPVNTPNSGIDYNFNVKYKFTDM